MEIFANRYKIIDLLGKGGMGEVYLVEDTLLNNDIVALKVLKNSLTKEAKDSFISEVKIARQINHPNIVRTFDFGVDQENRHYFTMEYLKGLTLEERLKDDLDIEQAELILLCIADGLRAIHKKEIIHRDLKPANIIYTVNGEIKITDFGIASLAEKTPEKIIGSAPYMAPECWGKMKLTKAVDLYALGVIGYQLFTKILPFDAISQEEMMHKHLEKKPVPPIELNFEIRKKVNEMILGLLNKNPKNRVELDEVIRVLETKDNIEFDDEKTIEIYTPNLKIESIEKIQTVEVKTEQTTSSRSYKIILLAILIYVITTGLFAITSFINFRNDKYLSAVFQLGMPLAGFILILISPRIISNLLIPKKGSSSIILVIISFVTIMLNAYQRDLFSNKVLAPDNHLNGLLTDSVISLWHLILLIPGGVVTSYKTIVIGFLSLLFSINFISSKSKLRYVGYLIIVSLLIFERLLWMLLTKNQPFIITASSFYQLISVVLIGFFNLLLLCYLRKRISP